MIAIWLLLLGWHVRREYFRPEAERLALGAAMLAPGAHWFVVRLDGSPIGIAQSALDTLPDGYAFRDQVTLDVPALGTLHRSLASTQLVLGPSLDLRSFSFELDSEIGEFSVRGEAEGDTAVIVVMDAGSGPQRSRIEVEQGLLLDAALTLRMAASGGLVVGNEFTTRVFDPSSLSEREVHVSVTEAGTIIVSDSAAMVAGRWVATVMDTVPVFRVEQTFGGVSITNWVDPDGQIVRAESALGFVIERTYYELARQEWLGSRSAQLAEGYGALIEGTAISSNVDVSRVDEQPSLAVRLLGVDLAGFDLEGGRQTLRGDTLHITRADPPAAAPYTLPYTGGGAPAAELAATPLIQSDDPRIRGMAERIVGGVTDPREAARLLTDWVYDALEKDVTLSVPSALQVLEARRGDCNEHTVLFVALARSLGMPTRTAVGMVHLRGTFYYHAWPEVWMGDWIAVDPTLGQYPADASHLRFLTGGLARQVELIRLIGRLRLEVT
ncbi:MAG: transglutaminase-like domain-containing protein [Gemmatimonadota bacterium]